MPKEAMASIKKGSGLTKTSGKAANGRPKPVIYCCKKPGIAVQKAVQAYCHLAFGGTGPAWYRDGLAQLGSHWKEGQREVEVSPTVLTSLRKQDPPAKLVDVLKQDKVEEADLVQAQASRWAVCHLLMHNPNYSRKFRDLGLGMMSGSSSASFKNAYGRVAKQLMFEYDQFVRDVDNGYRADLCAWKWKSRFKDVEKKGHQSIKVLAKAGWQPAVNVERGQAYELAASGEWRLDGTGTKATADGLAEEKKAPKTSERRPRRSTNKKPSRPEVPMLGQLHAIVMKDYKLSEPMVLGKKSRFVAPETGQLYFRCGEKWGLLADNSGSITVHIRQAGSGNSRRIASRK